MIALVCSDVHANIVALDAVLQHAAGQSFDELWFLGDAVGYGSSPGRCIARLRSLVAAGAWVLGNHDAYVLDTHRDTVYLGETMRDAFTSDARVSLDRLADLCAAEQHEGGDSIEQLLDTLAAAALRSTPRAAAEAGCLLVHGSVRDPLIKYGTGSRGCNTFAASDEFAFPDTLDRRCLLMGHSHFPCLFFDQPAQQPRAQAQVLRPARWMPLPDQGRVLINPGSVGQPRDNNPQASYMLLDLERWRAKFLRVPYAADQTADLIIQRGLPRTLAARLIHGE
jgi:predicted phosphodiesterase